MRQKELNQQLCKAITSPEVDLSLVEALLQEGADPLGAWEEDDEDDEPVLDTLFADSQDDEIAKNMPSVLEIFLRHGMDVDKSEYDVLWCLTWIKNEYGLQAVKQLCDAGLSASHAEDFVGHMVGDILQFELDDGYNPRIIALNGYQERWEYAIKMVLVMASYDHIFSGSGYIRAFVNGQDKTADWYKQFQNWDEYGCQIKPDYKSSSEEYIVRVIRKETKKVILSFYLLSDMEWKQNVLRESMTLEELYDKLDDLKRQLKQLERKKPTDDEDEDAYEELEDSCSDIHGEIVIIERCIDSLERK